MPSSTEVRVFDAIQAYLCLYDKNTKEYKSGKREKKNAWEAVSKEVNVAVEECQRIYNTRRTAFSRHLKKVRASIRSGAGRDDILPIGHEWEHMRWLIKHINHRKTLESEEMSISLTESEASSECIRLLSETQQVLELDFDDSGEGTELQNETEEADLLDNVSDDLEGAFAGYEGSLEEEGSADAAQIKADVTRVVKRTVERPNLVKKAWSKTPKGKCSKTEKHVESGVTDSDLIDLIKGSGEEDEADTFGTMVAKKMRRVNEEDKEDMELQIMQLFRDYFKK
ncbi:uncharacterized protein [Antedon mediterranea]|uniref:uncharacterized protein isoform X2 n=1 Tax=Antedon mediterranea TaxID=105859 RepID=UPI003AF726FF